MRRIVYFMLLFLAVGFFGVQDAVAGTHHIEFPNGDTQTVIDSADWDGVHSVVINFNNKDLSASGVMLDASGKPSNANQYGYSFIWVDLYLNFQQWHGSNDGVNWTLFQTVNTE